jgi:5-methylcytosine-specific restriction endonuclease McrA
MHANPRICSHDGCPNPRPCPKHPERSPSSIDSSQPRAKRIRREVLQRDNNVCQLGYIGCEGAATTVDHRLPASRGGKYEPYNLDAACAHCNAVKSDE